MVRRLTLFIIGAVAAATAAGALVVATGRAADEEKSVLADLISRALSTPATRVVVGRIEGALSSDATVHGIEISDRDGVWLKLDRARIVWRRLALVRRRLEIDALEVNRLEIMRTPYRPRRGWSEKTSRCSPSCRSKWKSKDSTSPNSTSASPSSGRQPGSPPLVLQTSAVLRKGLIFA